MHPFRWLQRYVPLLMSMAMILIGLVNFLTGVMPIFDVHKPGQAAIQSYSHYWVIMSSQRTSNILSIFLGVILVVLGLGLYQRKRMAWLLSIFILLVVLVNSFYGQFTPQTFFTSSVYIVLLLVFYRRFNQFGSRGLGYTQMIAWLSVISALAYGIVGSYLLRDQFNNIHTWIDAIYYTLVTYSTLGYGDIVPITANAKIFTSSMIVIGVSSFVASIRYRYMRLIILLKVEASVCSLSNLMSKWGK